LVLENLVPIEVVIKTGSLSTLSLSQMVSFLLNQTGHLDPIRTTTQLVSLALITSHLKNKNEEEESDPRTRAQRTLAKHSL
jgi:hypothetical protein